MSLRFRLIVSMALILLFSLMLGAIFTWSNATKSVRTEMNAAFLVGGHTLRNATALLPPATDRRALLAQLVSTFDGNRHLRASTLTAGGSVLTASSPAAAKPVPSWFASMLNVIPLTERYAIDGSTDSIVLRTDPQNEIGEVWTDFRDNLGTMFLFSTLILAVAYWIVGRALRPLQNLTEAFAEIGAGDFAIRSNPAGPPELVQLANDFNRMADRLSAAEKRNRRLHDQLLTLQDEERAELARDLHDEVGPFLFSVQVDAAAIARSASSSSISITVEHARSIQDAIRHVQQHVRSILGRLRPSGLGNLGLPQAIENLASFWRRLHPELVIASNIAVPENDLGDVARAAIYRIVQEGLSNAIRHGKPNHVAIRLWAEPDEIRLDIADDGPGLTKPGRSPGFGLIGMRERIAALNGALMVTNRPDGQGVVLQARWPRRAPAEKETEAA